MGKRRYRQGLQIALALAALGPCAPATAQTVHLGEELQRELGLTDPAQAVDSEASGYSPMPLVPVPVASPALGIGVGLAAVRRSGESSGGQPWLTGAALGVTSMGTWGAGASQSIVLGDDRLRMVGMAGYGSTDLDYYGIGGAAGERGRSVDLREKAFVASFDAQVRVFDKGLLSHVHAGLHMRRTAMRARVEGEVPLTGLHSEVMQIGPAFTFDTRRNPANPRKGVLVTGTWLFGTGALGGDFEHRRLELLSTGFFPIGRRTVLAVRKTACAVKGDAPFHDLCMFGGHGDLRGFEVGRYRDGASWALQFEARRSLDPEFDGRLALVAFAGVGGTAASSGAIWKHSHVLTAGGLGLRYRPFADRAETLRLDAAWGDDGPALYLGLGQAF